VTMECALVHLMLAMARPTALMGQMKLLSSAQKLAGVHLEGSGVPMGHVSTCRANAMV